MHWLTCIWMCAGERSELFSRDQWPGGQNLMTTPAIWRQLFAIADSPYFGLNYDPSHFIWQQIDYIKPLYEFKDKIFHVHFKDIKVYEDKRDQCGIMAYPLDYMSPRPDLSAGSPLQH